MVDFTIKKAIETAIKAEELGVKFYSSMAAKYSSKEDIKILFELLAKDEVEHKKQFKALLESSYSGAGQLSAQDVLYFNGCDVSKFFPGLEEPDSDIDLSEALKNAFEFEKESVLFYTGLKSMTGVPGSIDFIIDAERGHMTKIMQYIISDSKFRGIEDPWA